MTAAKKRKRLSSEARSDQIVERATRLFAQHGYSGVAMKEIARKCSVTEPALYRYFASKTALYREVVLSLRRRLEVQEKLAEIGKSDDVELVLSSLARTILEGYAKHPELSRILIQCSLNRHPMCAQAFRDLRGPFVAFLGGKLAELVRSGKIRPIQPEVTARGFVGMVMDCHLSAELWGRIQGRSFGREETIRNNVSIYVDGLAPRKNAARRAAKTAGAGKREGKRAGRAGGPRVRSMGAVHRKA
jgi:AcrR family transcriptional regulator